MRRILIALASLTAVSTLAVSILSGPAGAVTRRAACTPGISKINGYSAHTFCGPARATVTVGGKTYLVTQGSCSRTGDYFAINIGTAELGAPKKTKAYFGLSVGRFPGSSLPRAGGDGSFTGAFISFNSGSMDGSVAHTARVTLTNGRTKGTFSGPLVLQGGSASGSFSC